MKTYEVKRDKVKEGIPVDLEPYPRVILGQGGHKRATWIPLGKRDIGEILIQDNPPCPDRNTTSGPQAFMSYSSEEQVRQYIGKCRKCGVEKVVNFQGGPGTTYTVTHPDEGSVETPPMIDDVGVIALRNKETGDPTGRYLIVAPRGGPDDRVLVLWRVSSGFRGSALITPGEGVTVIGHDQAWHSGRGAIGSTDEVLVILKPGQELTAQISGRRVQNTRSRLTWDGKEIKVIFGDKSLFEALDEDDPEGDVL